MTKKNYSLILLIIFISLFFSDLILGTDVPKTIKKVYGQSILQQIVILQKKNQLEDLNLLDKGSAWIHKATELGLYQAVSALAAAGADVDLKSSNGETAADIAFRLQHVKIYDFLNKFGAMITPPPLYSLVSTKMFDQLFNEFIVNEEYRNLIAYVYPLFLSDREFFYRLRIFFQEKKSTKWLIEKLLTNLAIQGLPSGSLSLLASKELKKLLFELKADDQLLDKIDKGIRYRPRMELLFTHVESGTIRIPKTWKERKLILNTITAEDFANSLTLRESKLINAITFAQLLTWLKSKDRASAVSAYLKFHQQQVNFFRFLIVSEHDKKVRRQQAKKLLKVGKQFLRVGNFSGLLALSMAFGSRSVRELIEPSRIMREKIAAIDKIVCPNKEFAEYESQRKKFAETYYIPLFGKLMRSLEYYYETKPDENDPDWATEFPLWLSNFAQRLHQIMASKKSAPPNMPQNLAASAILDNLPDFDEDVDEAYFMLSKQPRMDLSKKRQQPTKLCTSSSVQLIKCLFLMNLPDNVAQKLFDADLWNGQALQQLFTTVKSEKIAIDLLTTIGIESNHAKNLYYSFKTVVFML